MPPKQIGVTGGIGAGKTLVCKIFQILGVPVYNADDRARWLMADQTDLIRAIKRKFGNETYFPDGKLNRSYLAQKIFGDKTQAAALNQLVHPKVADDFAGWADQNKSALYIIKEAALLFESGSYKTLDQVITVSAPVELRIQRIIDRDPQRTEAQIRAIMQQQINEVERQTKADFVIHNDEKQLVLPKVLELHRKFSDG